ncbi:MAG: sigma-70 family RNA polymerase sigma factor [Flavitalea sp.]
MKDLLPETEIQTTAKEFELVYQDHHRMVYANIRQIVGDTVLAQDILQDVFAACWEQLTLNRKINCIVSWLYAVSYNMSVQIMKKRAADTIILVDNYRNYENQFAESKVDNDLQLKRLHQINEAVERLSPRRKQVFRLNKVDGKPVEIIARELNTTSSTIKEYLKQSMRMVREQVLHW